MIDNKPGWSYWKVAELIKEDAIEIGDGYRAKNSEMGISGLPFARAGNVNEGFHFENADILSEESVAKAKFSRKVSHSGDITFTSKGTFGRFAFVRVNTPQFVYSPQLCYWRIKDNQRFYQRFLYYWMQGKDCLNQMIQLKGLTDMADYISLVNQRKMWLSAPDFSTQQKIASVLSVYDDLIENNSRRTKILEEIAQTIYREWFINFRFPGHESVQIVETEFGRIPEDWKIISFRDIIESSLGGDWGIEEPNNEENNLVGIIRGTDFKDIKNGIFDQLPKRLISESSLKKRKLQSMDIVIENSVNAKSRSAGTNLLITDDYLSQIKCDTIAASFCRVFRPKDPQLSPLIHLHLKNLFIEGKMSFYQNVAANGIANFQTTRLLEKEVIVLPNDEQLRNLMLDGLSSLTHSKLIEIDANLRSTRDLLLSKLISGEIDVSGLDIRIPEAEA